MPIESLYDPEDNRSVYCFPSEIMSNRSTNNPYSTLKTRTYHPKQTNSRVHRIDSYEYRKMPNQDDEKSNNGTSLRRKSLSSCDLFHVTSKTLTSPFDELQNWISNKRNDVSNCILSFQNLFLLLKIPQEIIKTKFMLMNSN